MADKTEAGGLSVVRPRNRAAAAEWSMGEQPPPPPPGSKPVRSCVLCGRLFVVRSRTAKHLCPRCGAVHNIRPQVARRLQLRMREEGGP